MFSHRFLRSSRILLIVTLTFSVLISRDCLSQTNQSSRAYFEQGVKLFNSEEYDSALDHLLHASDLSTRLKNNIRLNRLIGLCYMNTGDADSTLYYLQKSFNLFRIAESSDYPPVNCHTLI